jgi:hypothetical protein
MTTPPSPHIPPPGWITTGTPGLDPTALEQRVADRLTARQATSGIQSADFPAFSGQADVPEPPPDLPLPSALFHHLRTVNTLYSQVQSGAELASSPVTALPVIGRLWQLIRAHAHGLVLFYVNRTLAHQTGVNRHLVTVANELTRLATAQQRTIADLQRRLEALEQEREAHG